MCQTIITSPYSRFGIGDLAQNYNAWNLSMGGTSIGLRAPNHVNIMNPAAYSAFDSTSFVFEAGVIFNTVKLRTNTESTNRTYASLGYLTFGFPITNWWKTSLGLLPFSGVGYNIASDEVRADAGRVVRIYEGSGGINRVLWGNGFRITKNISAGINSSYLFGTMQRAASSTFPDSMYYLNSREAFNITVSGLYFDFGAQYTAMLNKDLRLTAGAVFGPPIKIGAKTDVLATTFFSSNGMEYPKDTVINQEGIHGTITIPLMYGLGFSFEQPDKWVAGADYRWQNWKEFQAFGLNDSLVNSYQVSAGVDLVPDMNNYTNYLKRMHYRFGLRYNRTYLQLRGKQLNEYAISLGFGFPLRGMKTAINFSGELGSRGTTQSDLIQETYFNFVLGFSIYERWFVKRKYY